MIREGKLITTIIGSLTRRAPHRRALCLVALALLLIVLVAAGSTWTGFGFDARGPEMRRIREVLALEAGMTIADIGAGKGELSSALASAVGIHGRIFATDVDRTRVEALNDKFRRETLTNVVVVEGGTSDTRLPRACCDAIVVRRVYHHLTDTAAMNASVFRALRPDGVLAIIDFAPPVFLGRGEFGVPAKVVIDEVTGSGFELLRLIDDWPGRGPMGSYCVLFRKPL